MVDSSDRLLMLPTHGWIRRPALMQVLGSLLLMQGRTTPQAAEEAYDKHKDAQTQVGTAACWLRQWQLRAKCMQCWSDAFTSHIKG